MSNTNLIKFHLPEITSASLLADVTAVVGLLVEHINSGSYALPQAQVAWDPHFVWMDACLHQAVKLLDFSLWLAVLRRGRAHSALSLCIFRVTG